ncbi:MAG: DnaJ domain-containing protein [Deltaproteobacteria bacterium]|jgi:DnaJ-class molecular chaperone|nr:DnaJ domain-containing protein [Deltaproteobacteria bacterium]
MKQTDYYNVLGVDPGSDPKKIRTAYRDLAFQYHPDRNKGNPEAADRMKRINEAYAVLSDPEKRKAYDGLRQQYGDAARTRFRKAYTEKDIFSNSDIHHIFEEMARSFGFRSSDEVFKEFYGKGFRSFEVRRPGLFGAGFFFFGTPGKGGMRKGRLPSGGGPLAMLAGQLLRKLSQNASPEKGGDLFETIVLDGETAQNGGPYAFFQKTDKKKLIIKIPPKVRDGQKIRLAGRGRPGRGDSPAGDLYLKVKIRRPLLQRLKKMISDR